MSPVRAAYNPAVAEARSGLLRKPATWLALLLLADLIAQLFVLDRGWNANPFLRVPQSDAQEYWEWSERIADGELVSETPFFSAPLYPYVLALLRKCGGGLWSVYLLQTLLRTATALVLYRLAAARFGRPAWGIAATALLLALGEPAFYAHRVLNSSLQLLLVAGFLLAAHRADERRSPAPACCSASTCSPIRPCCSACRCCRCGSAGAARAPGATSRWSPAARC
jgi:4-amino-4-deoxy-L-arabinose transferase-like glycosyltransferase